MAHLAFLFIDQGKDPWYKSEREKRRKREMMEETAWELRRPFPCRWVLWVLQTTMEARACCGYVRLRRYRRAPPFCS
jgi:hypothetical protein